MRIGYFGLGKMGKNMVLRLLEQGVEVVAWNRSKDPVDEVCAAGAIRLNTFEEITQILTTPRIIWLMLPQGEVTQTILDQIIPFLEPGDLVIDGANSFYKDAIRRSEQLATYGINFMDIGVSGGPSGARTGACLMVGGRKDDYDTITPLLLKIAAENAFAHVGPVGSGHFVKMVHNGIEYGMMQAIAEGAAVLKEAPFNLDLKQVFNLYNQRSVIESRLVGWAEQAFKDDPKLAHISSQISHTGEGLWTIETANELGVEVPIIEKSFDVRIKSHTQEELFRNKVVSALRGQFGGHSVEK
ncbi:decarboxylating 6-phosphogluconate dehydrogenase [candidate division WWE3 bacterium]|nr:decarboxylating 6-phosphogluconate dehydrogenase [candidate division WWE3 bacterium]